MLSYIVRYKCTMRLLNKAKRLWVRLSVTGMNCGLEIHYQSAFKQIVYGKLPPRPQPLNTLLQPRNISTRGVPTALLDGAEVTRRTTNLLQSPEALAEWN